MNKDLLVIVALIIAAVSLGGNFFVLYSDGVQIGQNKTSMQQEVASLQATVANLQTSISGLNTQLTQSQQSQAAQTQQIASAQAGLATAKAQLDRLLSDLNSNSTNDLLYQGQVLTQLLTINSTLASLTSRLNSIVPSVPLAALVIVAETYDSSTGTFDFTVQNNLNIVVYAQISASIYGGTTNPDTCSGLVGTFTSQLYQLPANMTTDTQMPLSQGVYNGCGTNPITSVDVQFEASQSIQVSLSYTFDVSPPYAHS